MKRGFKDLVPGTESLRKRLRQLLIGGTVAGSAVAPTAASQPVAELSNPTNDLPVVTMVNRAEKAQKLLLKLPNGIAYRMLQHRSHSSHSSHRSHSSHYSGSSGGSSAPVVVTPRPSAPVTSPAEALPAASDPAASMRYFTGVIDTIDKEKRTLTVKIGSGAPYTLSYRDDTTFKTLAGLESRLDESIEKAGGQLPFEKGEKVEVKWKAGTAGKTIAVAITRVR